MSATAQALHSFCSLSGLAVVGDGLPAAAIAASLASSGHTVKLWNVDGRAPGECEIRQWSRSAISRRSQVKLDVVSDDFGRVVKDTAFICLSVAGADYSASLEKLSPYLSDGQTVVLVAAPLGAALQFSRQLDSLCAGLKINILETGALYDSIEVAGNVALLTGPRKRVSICGLSRNETRRALAVAGQLWSGLVPASNVIERGFTDVECFVRAVINLCAFVGGSSGLEKKQVLPAAVAMVSSLDAEISALSKEFSVSFPGIGQALVDFAGGHGRSLAEILDSLSHLHGSGSGVMVEMPLETLCTDISDTFVLVEDFARLARLPVPVITSVIELAQVVSKRDLRKQGRGLSNLGLVGADVREIIEIVNG